MSSVGRGSIRILHVVPDVASTLEQLNTVAESTPSFSVGVGRPE